MKNKKTISHPKRILLYLVWAFISLATPALAAVSLQVFQSGEIISSSDVNSNFSNLDEGLDQIQNNVENICNQSGQIFFAAQFDFQGNIIGKSFICNDVPVNVNHSNDGIYQITIEDVVPSTELVAQVSAERANAGTCVFSLSSVIEVRCFNNAGAFENSPFHLVLIQR